MTEWSKIQEKFLINNYSKLPIEELKAYLKRNNKAIHSKVKRLKARGIKIGSRKEFLSKYWKLRYKTDKKLINNHRKAVDKLWSDRNFRKKHKYAIAKLFKNQEFYNKHRELFIKRRNSKEFKIKQSRIASKILKLRHDNPKQHKQILLNLRKNPSNQQSFAINYLRKIFGYNNVGCNDWKILEGKMEVDIPIYSFKIAIEWDGEYWHNELNSNIKIKDDIKNKLLLNKGWNVIRILSPSHPTLSKNNLEERLDILIGLIIKILQDEKRLT